VATAGSRVAFGAAASIGGVIRTGLTVACLVAALAWGIETGLEARGVVGLSAVFLAIALGIAARQVLSADRVLPGARFASGTVLKVGIVLLGARFSITDLGVVGARGAVAIGAALLAAAMVTTVVLRLQLLPRRLAVLIAVGTAICGNSAIAATAPVLGAKEEEVSYASAVITLFGMALVVVLPLVGAALGLGDQQFGILAGAGVHDSAQAIATGFIYSETSGDVATVTKLARTMALVPLVVLLSVSEGQGHEGTRPRRIRSLVPWFAIGFVALSLGRTALDALGPSTDATRWLLRVLADAATAAILVAMAGVGLTTSFGRLREMGTRPLVVGLVGAVAVTSAAGLVAVRVG
jgi:uncharacterized integral membrane protein (TIGR00698 family)